MSSIVVAGDVSGAITIAAPAVAGSGTLTLPVATDTLAGIAATQTLTNKTLVAPALGTPASGVLTNCTGVAKAALPAGSVLQVVNATYAVSTINSTGTYADTGLTATITPTKNTSKILVIVNQTGVQAQVVNNGVNLQLLRDATAIVNFANYFAMSPAGAPMGASCNYLDSPATTGATVYKTQFARSTGASFVYVQCNTDTSTITLMEIAG